MLFSQGLRRSETRVGDGVVPAVHVDGNYFPVMGCFDLGSDFPLVYLFAEVPCLLDGSMG